MLNLAFALLPSLRADQRDAEEGFLGKLALWGRQQVRYQRALRELHRLDDRDLDDIDVARIDFPELAWRHATGAVPSPALNGDDTSSGRGWAPGLRPGLTFGSRERDRGSSPTIVGSAGG